MNGKLPAVFAAIVLLTSSQLAYSATVAEDAQKMLSQGQAVEALTKLNQHLAKNPQDAEARFTRGLALVKLNRTDEAIKAFSELTRDYPQLPEPYNNLAVLYAQQGDYEKARDALEAALATHPSYATAHENLGDIYAALAGAAYNRALMLDQANQSVRNKLNLISQMDRVPVEAAPARAAAAAPAPSAPAAVSPPIAPKPAPAAAAPAAPAASGSDTDALNAALLAWGRAWSAQDLTAYFDAYSDEFSPEGGLNRRAWETQRRDRISRPKRIGVRAMNPEITMVGSDRARISFTQNYESDSFSDQVGKVLEFKKSGGAWKITREYTR